MNLHLLDLFSGIGGMSLAARWAGGIETVAFAECEPFPRAVLARHWPGVPIFEDVRDVTNESLRARAVERVDIIAGGFPCQDISAAGRGGGIHAERSGLWWEMRRIVSDMRPRWVLAENVPALRTRGGDDVLASLEEIGYACWPSVVGAHHVGAPHRRERVWIVAYANRLPECESEHEAATAARRRTAWEGTGERGAAICGLADAERFGRERWQGGETRRERDRQDAGRLESDDQPSGAGADGLADASGARLEKRRGVSGGTGTTFALPSRSGHARWPARPGERQHDWEAPRLTESRVGRADARLSRRLARHRRDALKALGNAIVPQVAVPFFEAIAAFERVEVAS